MYSELWPYFFFFSSVNGKQGGADILAHDPTKGASTEPCEGAQD